MTLDGSTRPVGLLVHNHGTLRIFRNDRGRIYVEVIGFESDEGREFLGELGQLEDVACEILVCDRPDLYPSEASTLPPRLHWRR
jgi:hypothetical protein